MKYETIVVTIIGSLFTLLGIVIGGYLSHKSARDLFAFQQNSELRIRSYSLLMGIKLPLAQAVQTALEAKALCEFYDARFKFISNDLSDREEAKRQNDRLLTIIPQVASLKRELFESLGSVMISYELTEEMTNTIDSLYNHKSSEVVEIKQGTIKTEVELESWKKMVDGQVQAHIKDQLLNHFEKLLPLMRLQMKEKAEV